MRAQSWLLVSLAMLAAGCGVATGTSSQSSSPGGRSPALVSRSEAMAAFTTYSEATTAAQVATEGGVLQAIDQAGLKLAAATGGAPPAAVPTPVPAADLAVFVPYQQSYPAVFMGVRTMHPTAGAAAGKVTQELWVFRRDARSAQWSAVAQASGGAAGPLPQLAQDADGYITMLSASDTQRLAFDPGTIPTSLAQYLQTAHPTVDEFAPGPATTGGRAGDEQLVKDAQSKNTLLGVGYSADTFPDRFTFRLASGGALEVFTLNRSEIFSGSTGGVQQLTIGADPTAVVGVNTVAPGAYTRIIYSYGAILVAVDPPKSATTAMVSVLGAYTGILSAIGVR